MTVAHHGNARLAGSNAPHRETHMKRLALVLAAAATVAGTGCGSSTPPCNRSVTVDWSFRNFANGVTSSCSTAGVDELDIYVNGGFIGTFPCQGPAVTIDVGGSTQSVQVDAIDFSNHLGLGGNRVAYRDRFTVNTSACGDQAVLSEPAEGRISLDYAIPNTEAAPDCSSGCTMFYQVHDDVNGSTAANYVDYPAVPYPNDILVRLPLGDYSVDFVQVVSNSLHAALKQNCTHPTFSVQRPGDPGVTDPQLVPAAAPVAVKSSCP
jgi:hypothetical protein